MGKPGPNFICKKLACPIDVLDGDSEYVEKTKPISKALGVMEKSTVESIRKIAVDTNILLETANGIINIGTIGERYNACVAAECRPYSISNQ